MMKPSPCILLAAACGCAFLISGCSEAPSSPASPEVSDVAPTQEAPKAKEDDSSDGQNTIGETLTSYHFKDIYFSGQPTQADLAKLKEQGFTHIVNLRGKEEGDYREEEQAKQVKELGLIYDNIPWSGMDDETIKQVTASVVEHRKKGKTLVHCSSGNRVGMWLAAHFYLDHGQSKEEALATAKGLGLTKPQAIKAAEDYLANASRP